LIRGKENLRKRVKYRNAILFVVLAAVWGSAFTAIRAGLEYFPPVLFAALRYDLAGVIMLGYAVYATDRWRPRDRAEWVIVAIGGVFLIAAYHAFLFVGEQGTTSAAAAVVVSLSPVLTTGFARVLLPEERLTTLGLIGLAVGFVGVAVLSNPDPDNLATTRTVSLGLVFLAAVSFALGSVLTRRVEGELPIETMEAWSMCLGAVLMHGVSLGLGESVQSVEWTTEGLIALGYLSLAASAAGFLIYFDLLDRLGPIEINLVSYAAPFAAAVTGVVFLGETPTVFTVVGFGLICGGFVLIKREAIREELLGVSAAGVSDD
jgi:drug/metabolite transporter (DMT)-like permease